MLSGFSIAKGATVEVLSGGTVSKTTVTSGGVLELFGGATASSTTVKSGGTLDVEAGFVLSGFAVAKGATVDVLSGGIASGTIVSSGGMVDVFAGGIASGATIKSGGDATISGGTLELGSPATASGTIDFAGGGTLKLDGTGAYGFVVSGYAVPDVFDLSAVNFISGTTSATYSGNTASGTLTVTDGTHSVSIALLGNYLATTFNVGPEGGGGTGTLVTDPPRTMAGLVGPHNT